MFYLTQRWTRGSADEWVLGLMRTLLEGKKASTLIPARGHHFASTQLAPAIGRGRKAPYTSAVRPAIVDACGEALGYGWVLAATFIGRADRALNFDCGRLHEVGRPTRAHAASAVG